MIDFICVKCYNPIVLQKHPNRTKAKIKTIDVQYGEHGHSDHQKKVAQAKTHGKHGNVDRRCAAEKSGEKQFSVAQASARFKLIALNFDEPDSIKIDGENVDGKKYVQQCHNNSSMRSYVWI